MLFLLANYWQIVTALFAHFIYSSIAFWRHIFSMGLQCSEKLPQPEKCFSLPLNENVYQFSDNGRHTKLQNIHKKLKLKFIQDLQRPEAPELWQAQVCGGIKHKFILYWHYISPWKTYRNLKYTHESLKLHYSK